MTSRTHDLFAFASLITVAAYYPPEALNLTTLGVSLVGNIVGSLLPDVDQASNRLWDLMPAGNFIGKIVKEIFLAHRTISHSILGVLVIFKLLKWILSMLLNPNYVNVQIVFISIMVGYLSHLVLDAFTEEGIPLLFPLKFKFGFPPVKRWRIKTGKWFEKFVVFPSILIYIVWFIGNNQESLINLLGNIAK